MVNLPKDKMALKRLDKMIQIRDLRVRFATEHHRTNKGTRLTFSNRPYLQDIYNTLAENLVIRASVQCGKSEMLIVDHFAFAAAGLDLFYVMPKYELRNRFVQNRVDKCIAYTPEYRKYTSKARNKVDLNNCSLKSFGDRSIIYAGSNTTADFREAPADAAFVDEMQECDLDNLQLLSDRMTDSDYKFRRWSGNPNYTDCNIDHEYLLSDQRVYNVPCKSCGKPDSLDWFQTVVEPLTDKSGTIYKHVLRDTEWRDGCGRDIHPICPKCGGILDRGVKGIWIPQNPNSSIEGYWISKMITGRTSYSSMWREFQDCVDSQTMLKWFYNSNLGLPFTSDGSRITPDVLDECALLEPFVVSGIEGFALDRRHPGPCSMGIDVNKHLDVRISYPNNGNRDAKFIGRVHTFDDCHELIERYNVKQCVIDSGPDIHAIPEFQEAAKCDTWTCKYSQAEGRDGYPKYDSQSMRIVVDRTYLLDKAFADLRRQKNRLPMNYRDLLGGDYLAEMIAPMRQLVAMANGNNRFEWRCSSGSVRDDQRHADAYELLASEMIVSQTDCLKIQVF